MIKIQRINKLKLMLVQEHTLFIPQIIELLDISEPTARRYIKFLIVESSQYIRIPNGIALKNEKKSIESLFEKKIYICTEAKKAIARECVKYLEKTDTLLLDSGSSCFYVALLLANKSANIVSTDILVALELSKHKEIDLHLIGGSLRHGHYTLLGDMAYQNLQQFHFPVAIISADAFDINYGLSNVEILEVTSKQMIRNICDTLVVLLDSSKFDKKAFYKVLSSHQIDVIITDNKISQEQIQKIRDQNITLVIAQEN
ncbi:MAG: DeoR/GlpR family DNA-binding transcription regulator [Brevinema sp.]